MNFITVLASLEKLTMNSEKKISMSEYEVFLKEFVFEKLQGKSFGQAFCERFDFNDTFLRALSDESARLHIEKLGYIK